MITDATRAATIQTMLDSLVVFSSKKKVEKIIWGCKGIL
jgi:hypothetical protein